MTDQYHFENRSRMKPYNYHLLFSSRMRAVYIKLNQYFLFFALLPLCIRSQDNKLSLKDSLDHKLDVSSYLVNMHGFIPVMAFISEPALGNFGLVLAPVFISPQKNISNKDRFHFPDITAVIGLYTLNKSWAVGAFRMGSFPKWGLRYRVGAMLGGINMDFYRTLPLLGESEFNFNFDLKAFFLEGSKDIYRNRIFLGTSYLYANSVIAYKQLLLPPEVFDLEDFDSRVGNLSFFSDIDYRNSIFTADKGLRIKATYMINRPFTGSDYSFDRADLFAHVFLNPLKRWVCAFRAEGSAISDGAPFYSYPFVYMRGIPMLRYQGRQTLVFETEQRFDLNLRWSLVGFMGTGRAFMDYKYRENTEKWVFAGGAGFRYLLSRLFNLRGGLDIALGPEAFAYYFVIGHSWNR